jgi:hypothetical protein
MILYDAVLRYCLYFVKNILKKKMYILNKNIGK